MNRKLSTVELNLLKEMRKIKNLHHPLQAELAKSHSSVVEQGAEVSKHAHTTSKAAGAQFFRPLLGQPAVCWGPNVRTFPLASRWVTDQACNDGDQRVEQVALIRLGE